MFISGKIFMSRYCIALYSIMCYLSTAVFAWLLN